ncbi:hypothetical protein FD755_016148 [Muntiacus reevesi]|uniref:Uncharacterized protein n=1 Tax=Muntiacus reevesi TaxID=9886 RepID=A0A5N3XGJ2_MUNRE|nr:hypothetical protein FD755_016148 [Muntiacus reevesi]
MKFGCLSFRQPYTEFLLNAVKTLETRCRPVLCKPSSVPWPLGMNPTQIQALLWDGDQFGHEVITGNMTVNHLFLFCVLSLHTGLVDVGDTLLCPENLGLVKVEELENQALLPNLQQNYLTALTNPHWLLQPVLGRARKDIFQTFGGWGNPAFW